MARLHCESARRARADSRRSSSFSRCSTRSHGSTARSARRRRRPAAACSCTGDALRRAGGIAAIRGELIDDCALARLLKPHGPIRHRADRACAQHARYRSFGDIRRMIVRCAFTQLDSRPWRLAGTIAAHARRLRRAAVHRVVRTARSARFGAIGWVCMALAFEPTLRLYRVSPRGGSRCRHRRGLSRVDARFGVRHLRGRGGEWKGRVRTGRARRKRERP